jgi:hypothetical protein
MKASIDTPINDVGSLAWSRATKKKFSVREHAIE